MNRREEGPSVPAAAPVRRLGAGSRARLDRFDVLLAASMLVVLGAYALGFRLDWSAEPALNLNEEEETAEAEIAAPAAVGEKPPAPVMAPAPPPAWTPSAEETEWERMAAALAKQAARHPGRVSIVLKDLGTGRGWLYHPDDLFPAASLIKVPVMIAALYRINEGGLSLGDRLVLRRRTRVGGSGSLKWRPDGTRVSVEELLTRMINESDNTATSMLLDAMGIGYVQGQFPRMGLLYTGIYPEGMSIKGGRVSHENYTTAREMTMLLEKIYRGEAVDKYASSLMMGILKRRKAVPSRLAKGLPRGWEIAHKTGLLRMACHDSAIFFTPHGDYAMTVLTGRNRSYSEAKDFISALAKTTFRYYTGADRLARRGKGRNQLASR
ncbi:MAG: class A beta-lactamase-related serine hydrolase [Elusimicrobia bacterium]|nr:class A beta-lactamase-related serine hydrolase [Elusimicrobiota bacterium]